MSLDLYLLGGGGEGQDQKFDVSVRLKPYNDYMATYNFGSPRCRREMRFARPVPPLALASPPVALPSARSDLRCPHVDRLRNWPEAPQGPSPRVAAISESMTCQVALVASDAHQPWP